MNLQNTLVMRELSLQVREPGFKSPWRYQLLLEHVRKIFDLLQVSQIDQEMESSAMLNRKGQKITVYEAWELWKQLKKAVKQNPDDEELEYAFHALSIDLANFIKQRKEERRLYGKA